MEETQDEILWQSLKKGDLKSFSVLFKQYYPKLYNYGLKICKDTVLTEDSLQDFFLYVFEHKENLSDLTSISPYLFSSYRRFLVKKMQRKSKTTVIDIFKKPIIDIEFTPEEIITNQENEIFRNKKLATLLNNLPKRQKEAIFLKYYSDLSTKDIAEIMNINYQSTVNMIHKAMKSLKNEIILKKIVI